MNNQSPPPPTAQLRVTGSSRDQLPQSRDRQAATAAVTQLCMDLLDAELQFYSKLEALLTDLATANLFSTEAATSLHEQIENLQRQRDEMSRNRIRCGRALAVIIRRPAGEVRMSELEPHLDREMRVELRQRRLEVVSRVSGTQRLLRRVDVILASRHAVFADLISALTGHSPSSNCYGANGRREGHLPVSILEAVS